MRRGVGVAPSIRTLGDAKASAAGSPHGPAVLTFRRGLACPTILATATTRVGLADGRIYLMSHPPVSRSRILRSLDPPSDFLYHYTRGDTLRLILDGATLRLGPYAQTNDPAENQRWFFSMSGAVTPEREDDSAYWRDTEAADRLTRRRAKLSCLTMDRPHDPDNGYGYFHRGWARARMWAQYAGAHSGACLVFDKAELGRAISGCKPPGAQLYQGMVEYEDKALSPHLPWGQCRSVRRLLASCRIEHELRRARAVQATR
jgi:hypothetical protein